MPLDRVSKIKTLMQENKSATRSVLPQFWKPAKLISRITTSKPMQKWLMTPTSLTSKLREVCPSLHVVIISEKLEEPLLSEANALGMQRNEAAWVRCIFLKCNEQNWVYARTIIPNLSPDNPWFDLQNLGTKPLGEVLFELPSIQRSDFEFARNTLDFWPYLMENINMSNLAKQPGFARRSIFKQQNAPLLVTEVFLPGLVNP
ncbi:chorismate lyase [Thiomicrorhabdus hydrogeniphila]